MINSNNKTIETFYLSNNSIPLNERFATICCCKNEFKINEVLKHYLLFGSISVLQSGNWRESASTQLIQTTALILFDLH